MARVKLIKSGKVRDIYSVSNSSYYLFVTSNRISAYNQVIGDLPGIDGLPGKGTILNNLNIHTKSMFVDVIPNDIYLTGGKAFNKYVGKSVTAGQIGGQACLVKKAKVLPGELIVRGYIAGSLWEEYEARGRKEGYYFGNKLPADLQESEQFDWPIFTPTTKSDIKDENISKKQMISLLGQWLRDCSVWSNGFIAVNPSELYQQVKATSLALYLLGQEMALKRGIIIADTKFELGYIPTSHGYQLCLVDEVLTPDSSRFWPLSSYRVGRRQESLDKQPFRDWLINEAKWDKKSQPPAIPKDVHKKTLEKYVDIYTRIISNPRPRPERRFVDCGHQELYCRLTS